MLALILHLNFLDDNTVFKLFFSLCCSLYLEFKFNLFQNGLKRCPECYGSELCQFFQNRQIQVSWFSLFLSLINPNFTKSVFYGVFNDTEVVVKRMVERPEKRDRFQEVDGLIEEEVRDFILCGNVRDVRFLFDRIQNGIGNTKLSWNLKSMEPPLLKYFQTQGKWPFPKYHGACGDLIVEEYKGEPLRNFLFSDFQKRSFLAIQLLEMAELFTFGHSSLAFYFTDYSLDNLVVDPSGNVFLIDLDNVIISNKSAIEASNSLKKNIHRSEILDGYNYAFSPSDICQDYLSDHNYFSVCKYLLSHPEEGLLKNIPPEIEKQKEIVQLLEECSQPMFMSDRFSSGQSLKTLLKEITDDFSWV